MLLNKHFVTYFPKSSEHINERKTGNEEESGSLRGKARTA
jgi:hypothetical protein